MYYIFGGNGFVGRYLANELLNRNESVTVCDIHEVLDSQINEKADYVHVDIRDKRQIENLSFASCDTVINLAANQYHNRVPQNRHDYFFDTNTTGTQNILEVMYERKCLSYIMFTTDMTYGKPQYLPVDINHPQNPFGPYGQSKKACEDICREFRKKGINITIFRPRMIIGPGRFGILVKLFKLIDLGLPVPTIGSGKNHYQMISVFDCVSAIICALEKDIPNKEYNLGSESPPNITILLEKVIQYAGSSSSVIHTPGGFVKLILALFDKIGLTIMYPEQFMIADEEYILDISQTKKDLDWQPKYSDDDMLIDAYRLYSETKRRDSKI